MPSDVVTHVALEGDEPVLIKTASTHEACSRLRNEARLLDHLHHPGVVEARSFEDQHDRATLTLRWAGSHTLRPCLPLPVDEAAGTAAALAATVADLHDAGVAHARINADHVVVAPDGRPVLCGFGDATTDATNQPGDVAALGSLVAALVGTDLDLEPIPERSWLHRRRQRWSGYQRRALLNLADQAMAEAVEHRPTARQLAATLAATVPDARLSRPRGDDDDRLPRNHGHPTTSGDTGPGTAPKPDVVTPSDPAPIGSGAEPTTASGEPTVATVAGDALASDGRCDPPAAHGSSAGALDELDEQRWEALWHVGDTQVPNGLGRGEGAGVPDSAEPQAEPHLETSVIHGVPATASDARAGRPTPSSRNDAIRDRLRTGRPATGARNDDARTARRWAARPAHAQLALRVAAAAAGVALVVVGWTSLRPGSHAAADQASTPRAATTDPNPIHRSAAGRPACPTVTGHQADIDHDGCREHLTVHGRQITAGAASFEVGRAGDHVAVGDWSCDGNDTPAVLRPSTGEIFVFTAWADDARPLTVDAITTAADADGLRTRHRGSCDVLLATRPGKAPIVVSTDRP